MNDSIVSTIFDKCKRCYSCIRECPAKAIKVINGQAAVISERCIVCGHCVKVCSQNAKRISDDLITIFDELIPNYTVAAVVAPSFAASFPKEYGKLPAADRKSTRLNSSHLGISYAVFCLKKNTSKPPKPAPSMPTIRRLQSHCVCPGCGAFGRTGSPGVERRRSKHLQPSPLNFFLRTRQPESSHLLPYPRPFR